MNITLSVSVTPEQYNIISEIAKIKKCSKSKMLKESILMYIVMHRMGELIGKSGLMQSIENMERNEQIIMHAKAMTELMQPYFEQALAAIPKESIIALEEQGKDLTRTIKKYNRSARRGRPPNIAVRTDGGA